jgi:citrate lyase subunit beta / citryl-CoA lyase
MTAFLFVPGDRPERFAKAAAARPEAVIADLEDAVAPERKLFARDAVQAALRSGFTAWVRINTLQSDDGLLDLTMLEAQPPAAVMIPKTRAGDVDIVRARMPNVPVVALIESIGGVVDLEAIASSPGVVAIAFGAYDLCAELGALPSPEVLAAYRSQIVFAARRAGVSAIDAPFLGLEDVEGLAAEAARGVRFGFDGMLAVHPKQIAPIRAAYTPSEAQLAEARAIVAIAADGGAVRHGALMIDAPLVTAARRVIARSGER